MLKFILMASLLLGIGGLSCFGSDTMESALSIINREGKLSIVDGGSSYTFKKDGTFSSMPYGVMDGRTISGHWRASDSGAVRLFLLLRGNGETSMASSIPTTTGR